MAIVACAVWGFIGLIVAVGIVGQSFSQGMVAAAVALAPGALLGWSRIERSKGNESLADAALGLAGLGPGQGFRHEEDGTGVAVNPSSKKLAVWGGGVAKCYDYAEVRGWEAAHEKWSLVPGRAVENIQGMRGAAEATGFYLTVRDLDNPKWRVTMTEKTARDRWMELLRQEINEGGVAA